MVSLHGKRIVLGISGGIAAYKIPLLIRLLKTSGAEVRVIRTPEASSFVTDLTLSVLSGEPVISASHGKEGVWNNHVELALWADAICIAPATSNTIAKMANGIADNAMLSVYYSAKCPVLFAPAMDKDMYLHPTRVQNTERLKSFGNIEIPSESGFLASGLEGFGRMAEPETLFSYLADTLLCSPFWKGKRVLLTSGPTHEPIDAVRFIGNRSSGKMGAALATLLAHKGALVTFISGPSRVMPAHPSISIVPVQTAQEMYDSVQKHLEYDVAICAAAVGDFSVENTEQHKIKKSEQTGPVTLTLKENPDILYSLGEHKKESQYLVGFALESENGLRYAQGKLKRKKANMIVLNTLEDAGAGFAHDTNKVHIITSSGLSDDYELSSKLKTAENILKSIEHDA